MKRFIVKLGLSTLMFCVMALSVNAAGVSKDASVVFPSEQVVKSADSYAFVNVKLVDEAGLGVVGHEMRLIPSTSNGRVDFYSSNLTNTSGEIVFRVSSSQKGPVTYSIYDVTDDVVLNAKAKVLYFNDTQYVLKNNYSSASSYLASGNSSSVISGFEFKSLPAQITAGESVSFSLDAIDSMKQTVTSYDGDIRFSVVSQNSSNVILPTDYKFTLQDQGSHTFSLAMIFQLPGTYEVEVRDMKNFAIFGKQSFVVKSASGSGSVGAAFGITNPVAGTYSNNTQVISGKASPGAKLDIYDAQLKLTSLIADVNGAFSYTVSGLSDGDHIFKLVEVNGVGVSVKETAPITITIDTAAPTLNKIEVVPPNPAPGTTVKVKLFTSESLLQAAALFQDNIYQMTDSGAGYYEADFAAPVAFGNYAVDFILVDQLGNESRLDAKATVNVGGVSSGGSTSGVLGDVTGVKAVASDHRVSLSWKAPSVAVNKVQHYRVFYGISPNKLTEAIDTLSSSTTWYVPNLKNDTKYYFAISAVDTKGEISAHLSNIVDSTPGTAVANVDSPGVQNGTAGADALQDSNNAVSDTGPEVAWLILLSFVAAAFYTSSLKRRVELKERNC